MQTIQQTFKKDCQLKKPYSLGPYIVRNGELERN